ncbi:MAG: PAS domain S-box protein [Chloroflexota bacterium]
MKKMLIVDDLDQNLYLLKNLLSGYGYEVVEAKNGVEALELARRDLPDLIISDILMPTMDGFSLCREWKRDEQLKDIPFIFYTATYTDPKDEELALRLGAARFIVKPIEAGAFMAILREVLNEYEAGRLAAPAPPLEEETVYYRLYNEVLIRKLEDKMLELEREMTERKRAGEALRLQLAALAAAANAIVITGREGAIEWINPAFTVLTGYAAEESRGRNLRELVRSGLHDESFYAHLWDTILAGQVWRGEIINRRKDGSLYPEEQTITPVRDEQGRITHFVAIKQDITARKRMEQALRESEAWFRTLADTTSTAIFIYQDERFVYVNRACEALTGYARPELLSMRFWEMVHPDHRQLVRERGFARQRGETVPDRYEFKILHQDGSEQWIDFTAGKIEWEGQPAALGTAFDITERKQAEEALQLKQYMLSEAQRIAHIGSWEANLETGQVTWSDEMYRIYQVSPDTFEPTPETLTHLIHPDDRAAMLKWIEATVSGKKEGELEIRLIAPDGTTRFVRGSGEPFFDETAKPVRAIGAVQDITALKQLEAEKEALAAQFYQAQKMDSIGRLAGGIAHDFNNMLVPIVGYAELGMLNLAPDSKLYIHFQRIKKAAERAAGLTRQILAFSRQQVLEMKTLELNQVIGEFEPMLRRLIGEDITLQTRLASTLPSLQADKGQLEQVLLNLAVNARDAMPNGGTLTIETAQVTLDEAYAAGRVGVQPGPYALLAVSDTGHGMDAATQQRIFEPFFTTKARGQGTGLGLATVFGIVKQHGGNIWVYSEPGRGTTFKIYLPLAAAPVSTGETEIPEADLLHGTETILVVEDEAEVRQLVVETLRTHGYEVLEAGEPEAGLALAAAYEDPLHLLLTDVIMPQMNGRELYRRLALERSGLKVLYMSGYTDNVIAHHGVLDEGVAFLQKPFTLHDLLQKVREVLGP